MFLCPDGGQKHWFTQQPGFTTFPAMQRLICADELYVAIHSERFEDDENILTGSLNVLGCTWKILFLNENPGRTPMCAFHLKHQAKQKLQTPWHGTILEHYEHLVYRGVTLGQRLTFKVHSKKLKKWMPEIIYWPTQNGELTLKHSKQLVLVCVTLLWSTVPQYDHA